MSATPRLNVLGGELPIATPVRLEKEIEPVSGSIVSRTLARSAGGSLTLFAFDAGQELSEHTSAFDAFVTVLEGAVQLTVGGKPVRAAEGETVWMPAGVPHAVRAPAPLRMLLSMVRR